MPFELNAYEESPQARRENSRRLAKVSRSLTRAAKVAIAAGDPVTNSVAASSLGNDHLLEKGDLVVGSSIQVIAGGTYGAKAGGEGLTLRLMAGAVVLHEASFMLSAASDQPWRATWLIVCRVAGAGGSVATDLLTAFFNSIAQPPPAQSVQSIDVTDSYQLAVQAEWAGADPDNTIRQELFLIQRAD